MVNMKRIREMSPYRNSIKADKSNPNMHGSSPATKNSSPDIHRNCPNTKNSGQNTHSCCSRINNRSPRTKSCCSNEKESRDISMMNCSNKQIVGILRFTTDSALTMFLFLSYAVVAFFIQNKERLFYQVIVMLMLVVASFHDIRERRIPLVVMVGILFVNVIHTVLHSNNYVLWIAGMLTSAFLLVIHLMNRKLIGVGDCIMLGLTTCALLPERLLLFLFLSFFFAAIYGMFSGISKRNIKGLMIPLIPCITVAYLLVRFA